MNKNENKFSYKFLRNITGIIFAIYFWINPCVKLKGLWKSIVNAVSKFTVPKQSKFEYVELWDGDGEIFSWLCMYTILQLNEFLLKPAAHAL